MKSQLLISHGFLLIKQIAATGRRRKNQVTFWEYPRSFLDIASLFVSIWNPDSARKVVIGRNPSLDSYRRPAHRWRAITSDAGVRFTLPSATGFVRSLCAALSTWGHALAYVVDLRGRRLAICSLFVHGDGFRE